MHKAADPWQTKEQSSPPKKRNRAKELEPVQIMNKTMFLLFYSTSGTIHFIWFTKYYFIYATKGYIKIQFRLDHLVLCVHTCIK